jgi:quercetin dioxygenase-like cupin family protein
MAQAGQTIDNPVTGERIVFRQTSADTGGRLLEVDLVLSPDGHVPGAHIHPKQEERFEIVSGTMKFRLGLRKIIARPGDVVAVPPGKIHKFQNAGETPVHARVQVRPALQMEELFETSVRLAQQGRTTRKGLPRPLDLSLFVAKFADEVRAPFPPAPVVNATLAPLRWMARRRGPDRSISRPMPAVRPRTA